MPEGLDEVDEEVLSVISNVGLGNFRLNSYLSVKKNSGYGVPSSTVTFTAILCGGASAGAAEDEPSLPANGRPEKAAPDAGRGREGLVSNLLPIDTITMC